MRVVSAFRGRGKKTAWQTWDVCPEASDIFAKLSQYSPTVGNEDLKVLEKFVVTMYDRSSTAVGIDEARLDLFARKQRPYEAIPPTCAALIQHYAPSVLLSRQAAYGARQQFATLKPRVLLTGDGGSKVTCGRSSGQLFPQLHRVVNS